MPGAKCGLSTNEGPAAYKEAIEFLKKVSPISAFTWVDEMARAASDHANDIGPKNIVGKSKMQFFYLLPNLKIFIKTLKKAQKLKNFFFFSQNHYK